MSSSKPCDGLPHACDDYPACPCGRAWRDAEKKGAVLPILEAHNPDAVLGFAEMIAGEKGKVTASFRPRALTVDGLRMLGGGWRVLETEEFAGDPKAYVVRAELLLLSTDAPPPKAATALDDPPAPGPWAFRAVRMPIADTGDYDGCFEVKDAIGGRVVEIWGDDDQAEANARLIAAAPELHDALVEFHAAATSWHAFHHPTDIPCDRPWEKVAIAWGDTGQPLPWTCVSGGSQTTHAMTRAAHAAASDAIAKAQERSRGG